MSPVIMVKEEQAGNLSRVAFQMWFLFALNKKLSSKASFLMSLRPAFSDVSIEVRRGCRPRTAP